MFKWVKWFIELETTTGSIYTLAADTLESALAVKKLFHESKQSSNIGVVFDGVTAIGITNTVAIKIVRKIRPRWVNK